MWFGKIPEWFRAIVNMRHGGVVLPLSKLLFSGSLESVPYAGHD